jgi:aldose 1-epimerase
LNDKFHHAAPYRGDAIDHTFKTMRRALSGKSGCSTAKNMSTFLRSDQPWLQVYSGENYIGWDWPLNP